MQEELRRLKGYIEKFPDIEIWIISKTNLYAELYWNRIKEHIDTDKKPLFISKGNYNKDGYNIFNAIIILCGRWYENPIALCDIFKMRISDAKFILAIGEIPNPKTLSIARTEKIKQLRMIADDLERGCGGWDFLIGVDLSSLPDKTAYSGRLDGTKSTLCIIDELHNDK